MLFFWLPQKLSSQFIKINKVFLKVCFCNLLHLLYNGALPRLACTCWNIRTWTRYRGNSACCCGFVSAHVSGILTNKQGLFLLWKHEWPRDDLAPTSHSVLWVVWFIYVFILRTSCTDMHEELPRLISMFVFLAEEGVHGKLVISWLVIISCYNDGDCSRQKMI